MGPHDHVWRAGKGTGRWARGCARCRSSHGQESGRADYSLSQGLDGGRQGWRFFCARRFGGEDPHACPGGRSPRVSAAGSAIFCVLNLAIRTRVGSLVSCGATHPAGQLLLGACSGCVRCPRRSPLLAVENRPPKPLVRPKTRGTKALDFSRDRSVQGPARRQARHRSPRSRLTDR